MPTSFGFHSKGSSSGISASLPEEKEEEEEEEESGDEEGADIGFGGSGADEGAGGGGCPICISWNCTPSMIARMNPPIRPALPAAFHPPGDNQNSTKNAMGKEERKTTTSIFRVL